MIIDKRLDFSAVMAQLSASPSAVAAFKRLMSAPAVPSVGEPVHVQRAAEVNPVRPFGRDPVNFLRDLAAPPAATEAPSEVEQLRRALVYVAMGLHGAQQHMLIKGITLMDGDRVAVKVADVNVDTGRVDVSAMFDAGREENASAFRTPATAVGASPKEAFSLGRELERATLEMEIAGDTPHDSDSPLSARVRRLTEKAQTILAAVGASVQPSLSDSQRLDWVMRVYGVPGGRTAIDAAMGAAQKKD